MASRLKRTFTPSDHTKLLLYKAVRIVRRGISYVDVVLTRPFPQVLAKLRPEEVFAARSVAFVLLCFIPISLLIITFYTRRNWLFWYQVAWCCSFGIGYILSRMGFHKLGAFLASIVLFVYFHLAVWTSPEALEFVLIPYIIVAMTNHWAVTLLFYFANVILLTIELVGISTNMSGQYMLIVTLSTMLLYATFVHDYDIKMIEKSEQRYLKFFHESYEAVAIVDRHGIVVEVNNSFIKLFAPRQENFVVDGSNYVNRNLEEYFANQHKSALNELLSACNRDNFIPPVDVTCQRIDETPFPAQISIKLLLNFKRSNLRNRYAIHTKNQAMSVITGKQMRLNDVLLVSFQDLSAQRQARDALLEAEKERQSNEAKSRFLANMSHEIRTPLNGVLGMLQLLEDTLLNKEQKMYLRNSINSANILLTLINDILDFSKMEAGLLTIDTHEFDLTAVVESTLDLLYDGARTKDLELTAYMTPQCPAMIMGDAARLRQVLINLVSNAIKFTHVGAVEMRVCVDSLAGAADTLQLRFEVSDTGIGLRPESIDKLFQRFVQVDSSITRNYGGSGLGLAISYNLVTMMGGEIGVDSVFGEGSKFWFTISTAVAQSHPLLLGAAAPPVLAGSMMMDPLCRLTIVAVAQSVHVKRLLSEFFTSWDYKYVIYSNFYEASPIIEDYMKANNNAKGMCVIVCNKGSSLDPGLLKLLDVHPSMKHAVIPNFIFYVDKSFKSAKIPDSLSSQILCYPIKQSQLHEALSTLDLQETPTTGVDADKQQQQEGFIVDHNNNCSLQEVQQMTAPLVTRVLCVDGNPVSRVMVARSIMGSHKRGAKVDVAASGAEALTKIFDDHTRPNYDVIFITIHTNDKNGLDTVAAIRKREKQRHPLVAISANSEFTLSQCKEQQIDGLCDFTLTDDSSDSSPSSFEEVLERTISRYAQQKQNPASATNSPNYYNAGGHSPPPVKHNNTQQPLSSRILVVEDNPINLQVVCRFLEKAGYSYDVATDGQQALQKNLNSNYGLILMDCQMPVLDGYQATSRLRAQEIQEKRGTIPIIAMTAHALVGDKEKCIAAGMSDYLQKPINRPLLLEMITKWIHPPREGINVSG